jgi:hypothetical protein
VTCLMRIGRVAMRVGEQLTPFHHARSIPLPRLLLVPRATRTLGKFGLCALFKGHSLSPRAEPLSPDSPTNDCRAGAPRSRAGSST